MKNRDIDSKAERIWENTCDWGYPGQMQVNSKELTLTRCIKRVENCPTWGEYSVWKNYSFATHEDLEKATDVFADCSLVG